jgi:hypothetical protein
MTKVWIILAILILAVSCSKNDKTPSQDNTPAASAVLGNYELIDPTRTDLDPSELYADLAKIDTAHIGPVKRFTYNVVVSQRLDVAALEEIALYMYERAQTETPFNALAVGFYDYADLIGWGYRLGYVEFAPNGKWEEAMNIKTGDYSNMQMVSHLFEPNWENLLTSQEAGIVSDLYKKMHELSENTETGEEIEIAEETALKEIAQKYNLTPETVDAIFFKYVVGYKD